MGFSSEWLEESYQSWRKSSSIGTIRVCLAITTASALLRTLGHAPSPHSLFTAIIMLAASGVMVAQMVKTRHVRALEIGALMVLVADVIISLPAHDSLMPAVVLVIAAYTFFSLPFYTILALTTVVSILQTCAFLVFVKPLMTNELLAIVVVHIWSNFTGIYICSTIDRIARNSFLSARNSAEAESSAEQQSHKLNRLLSAFLPPHLISQARHQITTNQPHLYNEVYSEVSVAYGRLVGFESVLAQCSSIDAARVLREFDARIDRLANLNGCTRIASDGITVVCSIPGVDESHATKLCKFSLELAALVDSFRDATGADVSLCIAIDSGPVTAGVVGTTKWHYDVLGSTFDNALLMQSNTTKSGVYISEATRNHLNGFDVEKCSVGYRVCGSLASSEQFPINKRFSLVTVPQAVNRVLQSVVAMDATLKTGGTNKKRKLDHTKLDDIKQKKQKNEMERQKNQAASIITMFTQKFKNKKLEEEYHKETDHWFIPSLAISIFFLVIYGIYHMLVMPRLITSLALIVIALTLMFFILLMLYIDYFHTFSQFITRTSAGHSVTILLIITILFMCGIVNTFSCPQPNALDVCQKSHFATFSFAMWTITTGVFIRFPSLYLALLLFASFAIYIIQVFATRVEDIFGPKEFIMELDLACHLFALILMVLNHSRRCEKLLRLDFLAVVKGVEEATVKEKLCRLNQQLLLNVMPVHVAPAVAQKQGDIWHHSHQTAGVAYIAISGFDLDGDEGINGLNFVYSHLDQILNTFKGVEKVKNANRFYIVAVGLVPDAANDVNETPWTIGELLFSLAQFVSRATSFAVANEFHVQIGVDCGPAIAYVSNSDEPRYELFGDTIERARLLMQAAGHEITLVTEEVYLALRPRPLEFSATKHRVTSTIDAYEMLTIDSQGKRQPKMSIVAPLQDATQSMTYATSDDETQTASTSFASELDDVAAETDDTDLEWITPETALMNRSVNGNNYYDYYDPYREPGTRASSVASSGYRRWGSSRSGLRLFGRGSIEAAASRVDRMIQELNAYGDFADVKPLEYQPFPCGSLRSLHRPASSACQTDYDNAESEAATSYHDGANRNKRLRKHRWRREATDGDTESQCSAMTDASVDEFEPIRWKSVHSIGYENEYEIRSETDDENASHLAINEMIAVSRDIRENFGDFQLATFDDAQDV